MAATSQRSGSGSRPKARRPTRGRRLRGGIDLGGTKIQTVVVDNGNAVIGEAKHPTPTKGGPQGVADAMAAALAEAAAEAGVESGSLEGVGVGSPGSVDDRAGTVSSARNLPGWEGSFDMRGALEDALGAPVRLGNDVQVATDGEFKLGAARSYDSVLGVFWGTGVGSGIVLDGKAWLGRGTAGEIGHMVIRVDGRHCTCGRLGCVEAYAGRAAMEARARKLHEKGQGTKLFKIAKKRGRDRLTSGIWARALDDKDRMAIELVDEAVGALGAGIASACNLLDPEIVVIGGGLGVRMGEPYVKKIRKAMLPHLFTDKDPPAVELAALGDLGGAIGAALLASERTVAR
jgi:glucokinase